MTAVYGLCAVCEQRRAEHRHHRKSRARGGSDQWTNLLPVCHPCHDWIHGNPQRAKQLGLLVSSWEEEPRTHWTRENG